MNIGIPALLFNIEESLQLCEEIDSIKHLEIGIDNLYECDELCKYKEKIKQLDLTLGIHLPMELNSCESVEYIQNSWIKFIENISYKLKDFDIKYFNMHLGYAMTNRLNNDRKKYLDTSIKFLNNLKINTDICIENVYCKKGNFSNIGNKSSDFEYIFNKSNNNLYFCYDSGHNLIDSDDYLCKLKDRIKVIHLSDNNGIEDIHIGIGNGILSKQDTKEILDINPEYIVLEICYEHIEDSINTIKQIIGEV